AGAPDVADRLAVVLDLLLAAGLAQADLHPELVGRVLERFDLQAETLDPLAQPDQVLVLPALLARQPGRRRQHHPVAAELLREDQVLVGHVARQPDRDPHRLWHSPLPRGPTAQGRIQRPIRWWGARCPGRARAAHATPPAGAAG